MHRLRELFWKTTEIMSFTKKREVRFICLVLSIALRYFRIHCLFGGSINMSQTFGTIYASACHDLQTIQCNELIYFSLLVLPCNYVEYLLMSFSLIRYCSHTLSWHSSVIIIRYIVSSSLAVTVFICDLLAKQRTRATYKNFLLKRSSMYILVAE